MCRRTIDETVTVTTGPGRQPAVCDRDARAAATVTIVDTAAPVVTVVATDARAAEVGADTGAFTFTRTGPTTDAITRELTR